MICRWSTYISRRSFGELADDLLLVDVFEDVGSVNEEIDGPTESHPEEDVQLESIDHQSHVLPVLFHLISKAWRKITEGNCGISGNRHTRNYIENLIVSPY